MCTQCAPYARYEQSCSGAPGMLSDFLERVTEPQSGRLVPHLIAEELHVQTNELARIARVHRNTLSRTPDSPLVQQRLGTVVRIVAAATDLVGDRGRAVAWFNHQPLAGFDGHTASELVAEGHADAVLTHLEMLRDGVY